MGKTSSQAEKRAFFVELDNSAASQYQSGPARQDLGSHQRAGGNLVSTILALNGLKKLRKEEYNI